MNKSKVVILDRHQIAADESFGPGIEPKYVPHADYMALEELLNESKLSHRKSSEMLGESLLMNQRLKAELAVLKSRIVKLVGLIDRGLNAINVLDHHVAISISVQETLKAVDDEFNKESNHD